MSNLFIDPQILYNSLVAKIGAGEVRGRNLQEKVENCPFCGADNQKHLRASFGNIFPNDGWGFHCFACGRSCSLFKLATLVGVDTELLPLDFPRQRVRSTERPSWFDGRGELLNGYKSHPQRYKAWSKYKGVTKEMVDRYQLGMGVLPGDGGRRHSCGHERLITPILDDTGYVVWFRGRAIECDCAKWHSAGLRDYSMASIRVALPQSQYIPHHAPIFIVENYVDAAIINTSAKYGAVATLSTSYWLPQWSDQLRQKSPTMVLVALDNDLAGNGGNISQVKSRARQYVARRLHVLDTDVTITGVNVERDGYTVDWETKNTSGLQRVPSPRGVILANHLLEDGFNVHLVKWKGVKDMGEFLV